MNQISVAHVNLSRGFRGGERQTELLIFCLAKKEVNQILICRKGSPLADHLRMVSGLEIIELEKYIDLRLCGHRILSKRCKIIHAHEARAAQWAFIHNCLFKVPYVITRRVPENIRENFFNQQIYSRAARLVAISHPIKYYLINRINRQVDLVPSSCAHFTVNYNVVDSLRKEYAGKFVVGHVGALVDKHKGQSTLIDAANILTEKIPNLRVIFIGDGEDKEFLMKKADKLVKQEVIKFLGFVNNVGDYLHIMDVFAYPSNYEGLGSVLLDVMEQRVPIVATAVGGILDIVKNNSTGLLFDRGDSRALAEEILRLYQSMRLRERLILNGVKTAKNYSPERMADSYLRIYREICKVGGGHLS